MPILRETTAASGPSSSEKEMEDLYSEEGAPEGDEMNETTEEEVSPHTETISKKLIMGKSVKPGDKVILTVVKDFGDEVEVKYGTEETSEPSMSEDEELNQLAT